MRSRIWTGLPQKLTAIPVLQRELAAAYERVGDVRGQAYSASLGDRAGATESYPKALHIREALGCRGARMIYRTGARTCRYSTKNSVPNCRIRVRRSAGWNICKNRSRFIPHSRRNSPPDLQIQRDLADIHNAIGSALENRNDMSGALDHHRQGSSYSRTAGRQSDLYLTQPPRPLRLLREHRTRFVAQQ